jgi:hypothetical protein
MKRRAALGWLAAGLTATAGCAGRLGLGGGSGDREDDGWTTAYDVAGFSVSAADSARVLDFDATLVDATATPGNPGRIRFELENEGARPRTVYSGAVPPFGPLWARNPAGGRVLLWRNYPAQEGVERITHWGVLLDGVEIATTLDPGQGVAREYELRGDKPHTDALRPGRFRVADRVSFAAADAGSRQWFDWTVSFRLTDA